MEALAAGDIPRARGVYQQVTQAGDPGVSLSALGIADIAMYEGRYDEAIAILPAAAKRDQDQQNILGAASKLVALAEAYQARGNDRAQQTSIAQARALSTQENVLVPAARLAIAAGRPDEARKIAAELGAAPLRPEPRLREDDRRGNRHRREAIRRGPRCAQRRTEAWRTCGSSASRWASPISIMAITPKPSRNSRSAASGAARRRRCSSTTCRRSTTTPPLPYWLGRAREMQKLDARSQFQEFLRIRQGATGDPLVEDARRRVGKRPGKTAAPLPPSRLTGFCAGGPPACLAKGYGGPPELRRRRKAERHATKSRN